MKKLFLGFLLLFCLGADHEVSGTPGQVACLSRTNFPAWIFDSLRTRLQRDLKQTVNLLVLPASGPVSIEAIASSGYCLLEVGTSPGEVPGNWTLTPFSYSLLWVLAIREKENSQAEFQPPRNLEEFMAQCENWKKENPQKFPWFDSLFSPTTLLRIQRAVEGPASSGAVIPLLQKALQDKILNPLSMEADESLAYEVLDGEDCLFSSQWIPQDFLFDPPLLSKNPAGFRFAPFPGKIREVPRITFRLYDLGNVKETKSGPSGPDLPEPDGESVSPWTDAPFAECRFPEEARWIESEFTILYRTLVKAGY